MYVLNEFLTAHTSEKNLMEFFSLHVCDFSLIMGPNWSIYYLLIWYAENFLPNIIHMCRCDSYRHLKRTTFRLIKNCTFQPHCICFFNALFPLENASFDWNFSHSEAKKIVKKWKQKGLT